MKSMFYGAAIAAVTGLVFGAGFKMPSMAEEDTAVQPVEYVQSADFSESTYQPDYLNAVSYSPAPLQPISQVAPIEAPEAYVTPAAYEVESEAPATPAEPVPYARTYASLDSVAPAETREPEAAPPEGSHSQGFYVLEAAPSPS